MKFIVTTTIQPPTEATIKFSKKKDWNLIVGDKKTPSQDYKILIASTLLLKCKKKLIKNFLI